MVWLKSTSGRHSAVVPSNSLSTENSSVSSSREAWRDGTGLPSGSLWVTERVVDRPSAPPRIDSRSSSFICSISARVASRWIDSGPITWRRIAQWPARKPALMARVPSKRPR